MMRGRVIKTPYGYSFKQAKRGIWQEVTGYSKGKVTSSQRNALRQSFQHYRERVFLLLLLI